jgi:acetoacetyl-CoA synthetase
MSDHSNEPMWLPTAGDVDRAKLTAFMREAEARWSCRLPDYAALYRWSLEQPGEFWASVWSFCGVVSSQPFEWVVDDVRRLPGAHWFSGARLNFAENLLRIQDDSPAIVFWNEQGFQRSLSFAELRGQVAGAAAGLRRLGVGPGDRVASYLPNMPETVVAMLAATSLGAIWSSCSPDFGLQGVLDRFGQIQPKILFTADGYQYNGRLFDSLARVEALREQLSQLERVVVVPYLNPQLSSSELPDCWLWDELLSAGNGIGLEFTQLPPEHPLYILYSSGTTGPPKCLVHTAGGVLLQHLKEHVLHCDLGPGDRMLYFTTCGWMMWNWLVSGLAAGSTIVLYDGSPLARPEVLFDLAERERLTLFGTSPKYLTAIEKAGLEPARTHDLSALRTILSTGAPLAGESFDYVVAKVKADVRLSSISGGTDICACFGIGNPILPVYRGEIQCRALGMKVEVLDDCGRPVVGEKGELVCAAAFPSLPLGFWGDPGGIKYRQTYFERFAGIWCHGDYAELTEHDGLVIYGRSDAVLNPGGVRIGTAEIYRQVEQLPEVLETVVVGQEWCGDVRVVLFVKLRPELALDEPMRSRICEQIRRNTTPRHVPAKIVQVADIPRTRSGKIVELAVRDVIHGRPVKNREALANAEALELFRDLPDLSE